jgi:hypothetical protein
MCKKPLTLMIATIALILFFLVSPSLATYTVPARPNYFPEPTADTYISFSTTICPITFSTLYRNTSGHWFFNETIIKTTVSMTITVFNRANWINYIVAGAGTQNIYNGSKPTIVYINGEKNPEGSGWSYAAGTITITGATSSAWLFWGTEIPGSTGSSLLLRFLTERLKDVYIEVSNFMDGVVLATLTTDRDGIAETYLSVGTYNYTATYNEKEVTGQVVLMGATDVHITFDVYSSGFKFKLNLQTVAIIIVFLLGVIAVVSVAAKNGRK